MADSNHIGVRLNGALKAYALWLLWIGVIPVYIIHEMVKDLDYPSHSGSNITNQLHLKNCYRPNFVKDTWAQMINYADGNPYLCVLVASGPSTMLPSAADQIERGGQTKCAERYCARSSS